ncbi:MAG: hypothetical protein RL026_2828 [Pseudomonadota bacterium]|jgi:hypothetical protein
MRFEDKDPGLRNQLAYPMEVGGPRFELVEVTQQKDLMLNAARLHAKQEYDRIMDMVAVLQEQAAALRRRLEVTEMVHAAEYRFQVYPGRSYWLARDQRRNQVILSQMGPADWSSGAPAHYEYVARVRWLGDNTWEEVETPPAAAP